MTVFKGSGFYHVGAANTPRIVSFTVKAQAGLSNCFLFLKGNNAFHPWIGQISAPTTNQKIAQYRLNYIVRALTIYAIPVAVKVIDLPYTSETGNAVRITYETAVSMVFADPPAGEDNIVDTLGMADRPVKTKKGLQTLATDLLTQASLDGGVSLLYAINPKLADGTASTAAAITSLTVDPA